MADDKNIFEDIKRLKLNINQLHKLSTFSENIDTYNRMFIAISEFIKDMEPNIDGNKVQQRTEALLRTYPPTLIGDLNNAEKWLLFNNLAHLYLTMAIDSIASL